MVLAEAPIKPNQVSPFQLSVTPPAPTIQPFIAVCVNGNSVEGVVDGVELVCESGEADSGPFAPCAVVV